MAALIQREQYLPWYYLIASFLLASVSQGCDIEVRLRSNTNKPFQFHVSAQSAGYWSDRVTVIGKTIERSPLLGGNINYHVFHIKAPKCDGKHWHFFLWKLVPGPTPLTPQWQIAQHVKAKVESLPLKSALKMQPFMDVTVKDDLKMYFGTRLGVIWCEYC